jgi:hypothetical protein
MAITTAGWGGGSITTWGWGGWGGTGPTPPAPTSPGGGSEYYQDLVWEERLRACYDEEVIQRVYNALASAVAMQQAVNKAWEDQLVRNKFSVAFRDWRKSVADTAKKFLHEPKVDNHADVLTWCYKTERQVQRWIDALSSEVREFGQPPQSIVTAKRREKKKTISLDEYSTKTLAKQVAKAVATAIALRVAIHLIQKMVTVLEL